MDPWEKINEISISKYNARFDDCNNEQRKEINEILGISTPKINVSGNNNRSISGNHNINGDNNKVQNVNIIMNIGQENIEMLGNVNFLEKIVDLIDQNKTTKKVGSQNFVYHNKKNMEQALLKTFEEIHCNEGYPENHNLYTGNKNPYSGFTIFKDGKWRSSSDMKQIKQVIINTKEKLVEILLETKEVNDDDVKEILEKQINSLNLNFEDSEELKNTLCHQILKSVYDNKEMIGKNLIKAPKIKIRTKQQNTF